MPNRTINKIISGNYEQAIKNLGVTLILKRNLITKDFNTKEDILEIGSKLKEKELLYDIMLSQEFNEEIISTIKKVINEEKEDEIINSIFSVRDYGMHRNYTTPDNVSNLMVKLLDIKKDSSILDAFSGEGTIDSIILDYFPDSKIIGEEIHNDAIIVARIKLYAQNKYARYNQSDLLRNNLKKEKYDYAIADIPAISSYDIEAQRSLSEVLKDMEVKINNKMSFTWLVVYKLLHCLKSNGRAIIATVFSGSLFSTIDREARKQLIDGGYIESIILLPDRLLQYTTLSVLLIVFNKKGTNKQVKFVDMSKCAIRVGRNNELDLNKAIKKYENNGIMIDSKEIIKNNYSLNLNAYTQKVELKSAVMLSKVMTDIFRGYQITSKEVKKMLVENSKDMNYQVLEISNVNTDGEIAEDLTMINSGERNFDRYLLKNEDIILSARGETTKKAIMNIEDNENIIANGSINVIRVNKERILPMYLKMFLDSQKGIVSINKIKCGVAIPALNVGDLQNMLIPCPSIDEQRKLVEKYEVKLEIIASTKKRLEELKNDLQNLADQL